MQNEKECAPCVRYMTYIHTVYVHTVYCVFPSLLALNFHITSLYIMDAWMADDFLPPL